MFPGELRGLKGTTCEDCSEDLELQVLSSANGYYLGYFCPHCGPFSRETEYYGRTRQATAKLDLSLVKLGGIPNLYRGCKSCGATENHFLCVLVDIAWSA